MIRNATYNDVLAALARIRAHNIRARIPTRRLDFFLYPSYQLAYTVNDRLAALLVARKWREGVRVQYVYVFAEHRRKGYARALLDALTVAASKDARPFIALHVDVTNIDAIALYDDAGFKNVQLIENYYRNSDAYRYTKTLKD